MISDSAGDMNWIVSVPIGIELEVDLVWSPKWKLRCPLGIRSKSRPHQNMSSMLLFYYYCARITVTGLDSRGSPAHCRSGFLRQCRGVMFCEESIWGSNTTANCIIELLRPQIVFFFFSLSVNFINSVLSHHLLVQLRDIFGCHEF